MATEKQRATINLYAEILYEAKGRLQCIEWPLGSSCPLPPPAIREFCFLQLRMLTELIALGCLIAHGDITNRGKLRKEDSPGKIILETEKLHPDFYPLPVKVTNPNPTTSKLDPIRSGFLTQSELPKLYGISGNFLHRGTVEKILSAWSPGPQKADYSNIVLWARKINVLLKSHRLILFDGRVNFVAQINKRGEKPSVYIVEPSGGARLGR